VNNTYFLCIYNKCRTDIFSPINSFIHGAHIPESCGVLKLRQSSAKLDFAFGLNNLY
jgi:hypothetical protein